MATHRAHPMGAPCTCSRAQRVHARNAHAQRVCSRAQRVHACAPCTCSRAQARLPCAHPCTHSLQCSKRGVPVAKQGLSLVHQPHRPHPAASNARSLCPHHLSPPAPPLQQWMTWKGVLACSNVASMVCVWRGGGSMHPWRTSTAGFRVRGRDVAHR